MTDPHIRRLALQRLRLRTNAAHANHADCLASQLNTAQPLGLPRAPAAATAMQRTGECISAI